jgi:hypothetical protein
MPSLGGVARKQSCAPARAEKSPAIGARGAAFSPSHVGRALQVTMAEHGSRGRYHSAPAGCRVGFGTRKLRSTIVGAAKRSGSPINAALRPDSLPSRGAFFSD